MQDILVHKVNSVDPPNDHELAPRDADRSMQVVPLQIDADHLNDPSYVPTCCCTSMVISKGRRTEGILHKLDHIANLLTGGKVLRYAVPPGIVFDIHPNVIDGHHSRWARESL
jgi:hypothetical protein